MLSILKKTAMAVTGASWFLFLIAHLLGNFTLFNGTDAINEYSHNLHKLGPLILVAELSLLVLMLLHVVSAFQVVMGNRRARPISYGMSRSKDKATLASRTMQIGGPILLLFLIVHVRAFRFGDTSGAGGLGGVVMKAFADPMVVAFYMVALAALGLHLSHGLGSAFQTLGLSRPKLRENLNLAGVIVGWALTAGFMALPIWGFMMSRG
ncbi:MAG: succinate dehydrogenase cytochrome b subunit [Myxococcota bacterium]